MNDLSTPLLNALNDRINDPNTRCDGSSAGGGGAQIPPAETQVPDVTEYPTSRLTQNPSLQPTGLPSLQPTPKPSYLPTEQPVEQQVQEQADTNETSDTMIEGEEIGEMEEFALGDDSLFFPHFESDTAECRNDLSWPDYVKQDMLSSESECCETYFINELVEQCKTSSYTQNLYYPKFQDNSCVNDGKQSDWMVGNYLEKNKWLCCHNFFSYSDQLLEGCLGDLECANC